MSISKIYRGTLKTSAFKGFARLSSVDVAYPLFLQVAIIPVSNQQANINYVIDKDADVFYRLYSAGTIVNDADILSGTGAILSGGNLNVVANQLISSQISIADGASYDLYIYADNGTEIIIEKRTFQSSAIARPSLAPVISAANTATTITITLETAANNQPESYELQQSLNQGTFAAIENTWNGTEYIINSGLIEGQEYRFRALGQNSEGKGPFSEIITVNLPENNGLESTLEFTI